VGALFEGVASAWWTRRSIMAEATMSSLKTSPRRSGENGASAEHFDGLLAGAAEKASAYFRRRSGQ
jgi:hypothetical protein